MKKIIILCLLVALIAPCFYICVSAQPLTTQENTPTESTAETAPNIQLTESYGIDSAVALLGDKRLVKNLKSAIVFEANSNTLMYAWHADDHMFPASFVKILTALVAIENGNLTDVVRVNDSAVSSVPHDAVSADLQAGEELSLEDLLYCLLLGSSNDAAVVIAEHISGTEAAFVELMNDYASELGCKDTVFVNSHGLHSQQQYTTARDTARILAAAIKNESFYKIFTAIKHTIEATNMSPLRNLLSGNLLMDTASKLYYDNRVVGGRTGVTEDGRRCLATVAENNGMQLITVVMGADSVYQADGTSAVRIGGYHETTELLNAGLTGFKTAEILYEGQVLRQFQIDNGDNDLVVGTAESVTTILPEKATLNDLHFQYRDVHFNAPIEKGQQVSTLEVWHQNMCVAKVDLYAMNRVSVKEIQIDTSTENETGSLSSVLITIVIIAIAGAVTIFGIRILNISRFKTAKNSSTRRRSK